MDEWLKSCVCVCACACCGRREELEAAAVVMVRAGMAGERMIGVEATRSDLLSVINSSASSVRSTFRIRL